MRRLAVALVLLTGCELFANIPNATLATDATGDNCASGGVTCEPPTPVCKLDTSTCVECEANDDCPGAKPFCDTATNLCNAGCTADAQCESGACLPDGTCAEPARIKYAAPGGTGDCSAAMPCAIETAVAQLAPGVDVIQLATGTYDLAASLTPTADVTFNGTGVTLRIGGGGTALQYSGVTVQLHRITLDAAGGIGVFCMASGKLFAKGIRSDGAVAAILANPCEVRIDRSRFSANTLYAMLIATGPFVMTSSFVTNNGGAGSNFGGLLLDNLVAGSVIEHNTIAGNTNSGMNGAPAGLCRCMAAVAPTTIRNNIIRGNAIDPACVVTNNVIDAGYTGVGTPNVVMDPGFVNAAGNDYHLVPGSPVAGMSDPAAMVFVDFDGEPRPQPAGTNPDPGADEIP